MSLQTVLLYVLTWSFVALTPGPAVICVMSQAAKYGLRAAWIGILGIQMGNIFFFGCIAFGLVTLLATAAKAFAILQILGAGYLFLLGIRIIGSSFGRSSADPCRSLQSPPRQSNLVLQALAIQVTNPKALLFVSALLPQFVDPHSRVLFQLAILMICTLVVDAVVLVSYACLAEQGTRSFRSSRLSRWLERAFGAALVVFGVRLLFWRR
jgi:homoserine/homoserine lactone efflux protein